MYSIYFPFFVVTHLFNVFLKGFRRDGEGWNLMETEYQDFPNVRIMEMLSCNDKVQQEEEEDNFKASVVLEFK